MCYAYAMRSIVVAYDDNRGIGAGGRPPWGDQQMNADKRRFRHLTANSTVIMGRTSYETFHGFLPGRQNIVITRRERMSPGVIMVHSLDEAYAAAHSKDINIIGGASIFKQALYSVDRIYVTEVHFQSRHVDSFFPELDPMIWHEISREDFSADELNVYDYSFVVYARSRNNVSVNSRRAEGVTIQPL
jgi:dihydrofolate reductase